MMSGSGYWSGSVLFQSRGVGTGEMAAGCCAPIRVQPAAPASAAVVRNDRRSMGIWSVSDDLEVALHRSLSPRARDHALKRPQILQFAVDDVMNRGAALVFAVAFEVHHPRGRIKRGL